MLSLDDLVQNLSYTEMALVSRRILGLEEYRLQLLVDNLNVTIKGLREELSESKKREAPLISRSECSFATVQLVQAAWDEYKQGDDYIFPIHKAKEYMRMEPQGKKIEAIKVLREAYNLGLKDAKDIVEGVTVRRVF